MSTSKRPVYCVHCNAEIESRYDLVVSQSFLSLYPYHNSCYSEAIKGCQSIVLGDHPVNGTASNWSSGFALLIGIILLFISKDNIGGVAAWVLNVVVLLVPLVRFCSWYMYERYLDK
ncbi:hypothetical protein [Paenibacillus sp. Marseille-Q4541]|uniref:hypothetical protein n=1 Tax=Paenibacillus sp. Marseille-Q4541 TaxID=2831522 RepID=UPI001BA59997|nr:hypothetical protein [Paenibacillus sp. Marseille-Q4541]